ncbi:monovalent cation/H+ antiporter subunit E [Haloplanus pelagicus]|jgi:multicomponent Na+:H+ antiporter subunit E|uniref:monovalent cation/H+ antiporter subunit E n=1 Tax=Haloplanus pelagicus TaxID=2949995 RepID=UPI002041E212|nr:monovalent cation/H+ antiporter subunit E [Haloplanus sp. HW8-1]
MATDRGRDLLVPVGDSETLRRTVTYAVERAHESADSTDDPVAVHFIFPARWRIYETDRESVASASSLLERAVAWATEDLEELIGEDHPPTVTFESATVGTDEYVFSPGDFAAVVGRYAEANEVDRIVVDPSFRPGGNVPLLRSFEAELAERGFDVLEAPVTRRTSRRLPFTEIGLRELFVVYAASLLFYLALGGWHVTDAYELVTGVATAAVVTLTLARVSMKGELPRLRYVGATVLRMAIYTPILLWEITKANVALAYVVLHPDLPIEPRTVEFDAAVWGDMPVTTLANSITLTPGTLTVDVSRQHFMVHALIPGAEDDLLEGTLERFVRFVFYGRESARIPSPRERRDDEGER